MNTYYYDRFKIFTENKYWEKYLKWAYKNCIEDLSSLGFYPDFTADNFTALLCGTSGEATSLIFVDFILSKNPSAKIIILDISETQLEQSKVALFREFPNADISFVNTDAKRTDLESDSINYIETDAFFEFFNLDDLILLLIEWKRILKSEGWVTTRAFASDTFLEKRLDFIRDLVATKYLGINVHTHHLADIIYAINKSGLQFVQGGGAYCPTFKRFSLMKSKP